MITGYNTDVDYDGVTYHVQTEDKGLQAPIILTLLYSGGEILASKRTSYDDLVAGGLDEDVLRKRLERQHKLICAAVHAGRIEDLKRMSERDASAPKESVPPPPPPEIEAEPTADPLGVGPDEEGLILRLMDEPDLRGGRSIVLTLVAGRVSNGQFDPIKGAQLKVKVLGTTFSPTFTSAITDEQGIATVSLALPNFDSGRAAILVKAEADGEFAELRRIILPSNS